MAFIYRVIIRRLIHIAIGFIIGFLYIEFNEAYADYNGIEEYPSANSISWHSTFMAACQSTFDRGPAGANSNYYYVSIDPSTEFPICRINVFQGSNYQDGFTLQKYKNCSGTRQLWNSGQGAGICSGDLTCTPPKVLNSEGTSCVNPPNPCENKTLSSTTSRLINQPSNIAPNSVCIANCTYNVNFKNITICAGGKCSLSVVSPSTGQECSVSPSPASGESETPLEKTPEEKCIAAGQSYGTINGTVVCAKAGTPSTPPVTVNDTKSTTNSAGTGNTTTTTTINNNTVTTTTTTTPANGGEPITETTEQDISGFCEENPTSKICKDDEASTFGGSCAASFTCDGDAIQCSIAQEQHKRNCTLYETQTTLSQQGQAMIDSQGNNPASLENRETINLSNMVNEGSNIGSGTFQDKVIPLKGSGIVLPFSKLNDIVQLLGAFLLAGAYLNAARIVGVR